MTVARKVEFDGARANHQAILRLRSAHRLDADKMPGLQRNRFGGRMGKAELESDRAAALAEVSDLNALSLKHARQRLGLGPSVSVVRQIADQHARRHFRGEGSQRAAWVRGAWFSVGRGRRRRRGLGLIRKCRFTIVLEPANFGSERLIFALELGNTALRVRAGLRGRLSL